jgi:hypothetical protein
MPKLLQAALAGAALALALPAVHAASSGIAVTPERTSLEAGVPQTISARFFDAAGRPSAGETVRFTNDACATYPNGSFFYDTRTDANGIASATATALSLGGTVCTVTASAGAQVRYQVFTYRLNQIAIIASAPSDPILGETFRIPVEVRMGAYALPNVDVSARIVNKSGSAQLLPSVANTGVSGNGASVEVHPTSAGDFDVELAVHTLTKGLSIRYDSAEHEDMWWSGFDENGWGMSIVEHRDILFIVLYAYDDAGRPTWYVVSNGTWNAAKTIYTGDIHSPSGTPYYSYDAARLAMGNPVGTAKLTFADRSHATFDYTINGVSGRKSITRFLFGPAATPPMFGRTDMWWGGRSQNGWGLSVIQQNAALFVMWYTYDANGRPYWFAMPAGDWISSDTYEGRVYRTTGSPWLGRSYDAGHFKPVDIGSYRLRFSGDGATFEYTIEGRSGTMALERFGF